MCIRDRRITVHAKFHTGHRQLGYPGKCKFVHGHTWRATITVTTDEFPRDDLDMSLDFGDLKRIVRFLDHKMLVTEKPGRLRVVAADGTLSAPVAGLPTIATRGQGGLLDVALDPAFATNQLVYWSFSEALEDGTNHTAVARGKFVDGAEPRMEDAQVIYRQAPSMRSNGHFGSRLAFGRDGTLFVTQGDRQIEAGRLLVQQMDKLQGKVFLLVGVLDGAFIIATGIGLWFATANPFRS